MCECVCINIYVYANEVLVRKSTADADSKIAELCDTSQFRGKRSGNED